MENNANTVTVLEFEDHDHLSGATLGLMELRKSGSSYPPFMDADNTATSLASWLMEEDTLFRFVALVNGEVAGHISVTHAHPYLTDHLEEFKVGAIADNGFLEISKFFVSPSYQKHGVGKALFSVAIENIVNRGYEPALAVIETSTQAISFYGHHGLVERGSFNGIHGVNFVFS